MTSPHATSSAGGSVLTDREIAERIMRMLKRTPLCADMSWRLLADLVRAVGVRRVGDAGAPTRLDFTVLAVPEHTLFLSDEKHDHPPLAPSSRVRGVLELTRGLHLRHHPRIDALSLETPKIEAPRGRIVRYYALDRHVIDRLPAHVTRAMNFAGFPGVVEDAS
jgi:hypothetical protein